MRVMLVLVLAAGGLIGCGSPSGPAGKPTEEAIKADKAAQEKVEQEERGKPIKGKR
ncbi:hypothetical protein R5W24_005898 [Gemmata sp. JC717]|uniref:hypothetical protein n=1 Tax=Gemmata algarum TaxID=2975278 RepID=UPI0021BB5A01|nr:hypothetical protein [Gemmata algarum]MDY3556728.1 hypothetical protein [Gemmata algarum]